MSKKKKKKIFFEGEKGSGRGMNTRGKALKNMLRFFFFFLNNKILKINEKACRAIRFRHVVHHSVPSDTTPGPL